MPVMKYTLDGVNWERIEGAPGPAGPTGPTGPAGETGPTGPAGVSAVVAPGVIVMFGGSVAPEGWHLCNGTAHGSTELAAAIGSPLTPNLVDRFIVGAGATYAQGAVGGEATHALTEAEMPYHAHTVPRTNIQSGPDGHSTATQYGNGTLPATFTFAPAVVNAATGGYGDYWHTDPVLTTALGSGAAHENRPPYYALTFIIKK